MTSSIDRPRVQAAVRELLAAIGDDPDRPGLRQTPERVADAYAEFFSGMIADPTTIAEAGTIPVDDGDRGSMVLMRGIRFRSTCEHHLLPFAGVAHVAYEPAERVVGLGTLTRVLDAVASRPQVQERLGEQVARAVTEGVGALGVLVVLEAEHQCVTMRGARQPTASTVTIAASGSLAAGGMAEVARELLHERSISGDGSTTR